MSQYKKPKELDSSHLILAIGGAMAGAWWIKNEIAEGKKSRAEKDYPEEVAEICEEIGELLDDWTPINCKSENDYTQDLFDYLEANCDWEIEIYPNTSEGIPDILIENLLALELKVNPNKAERDRLITQCLGYSRQWVTWAVIIDASASKTGKIENLLADKGLEYILVLPYT